MFHISQTLLSVIKMYWSLLDQLQRKISASLKSKSIWFTSS